MIQLNNLESGPNELAFRYYVDMMSFIILGEQRLLYFYDITVLCFIGRYIVVK